MQINIRSVGVSRVFTLHKKDDGRWHLWSRDPDNGEVFAKPHTAPFVSLEEAMKYLATYAEV